MWPDWGAGVLWDITTLLDCPLEVRRAARHIPVSASHWLWDGRVWNFPGEAALISQ